MNRIHTTLLAALLAIGATSAMAQDATTKGLTGDRATMAADCGKATSMGEKGPKDGMSECGNKPMKKAKMKKAKPSNSALQEQTKADIVKH